MRRLQASIPPSYTIYKSASSHYAESCIPGGTDYGPLTNASTLIQNAINALSSGGAIRFKRATYTIPAKLTATVNDLVLDGEPGTVLQLGAGVNDHLLELGDGSTWYNRMGLRNLYLDGNKANQGAVDKDVVYARKIQDSAFENCDFVNAKMNTTVHGAGFVGEDVRDSVWRQCRFTSNDGSGIDVTATDPADRSTCRGNLFDHCIGESNGISGLVFGTCEHSTMISPIGRLNGNYGVALDQAIFCTVEAPICTENLWSGLGVFAAGVPAQDAVRNSIIGGSMRLNKYHGINIEGVKANETRVIGTAFQDNSQDTNNTYDDIHINDAQYCQIIGARMYQAAAKKSRYGVAEEDIADYNLIQDCTFAGHATKPVYILGVNTRLPEIFVPANDDQDANATLSSIGDHQSISLADGATATSRINVNFASQLHQVVQIVLIVTSPCTGGTTLRWNATTDWGLVGNEAYNAGSGSIVSNDSTLIANRLDTLSLADAVIAIAGRCQLGITFQREGAHANDTLGAVLHLLGVKIRYV